MSLFFCAQNFFFFCAYQGWGWLAPRPSAAIFTPIYTLKKHSKNVLIYSSSSIRIDLNYWPTRQITTAAVANGNKNLPPLNARAHTHEHLDKRLARPFRDRKGKKNLLFKHSIGMSLEIHPMSDKSPDSIRVTQYVLWAFKSHLFLIRFWFTSVWRACLGNHAH